METKRLLEEAAKDFVMYMDTRDVSPASALYRLKQARLKLKSAYSIDLNDPGEPVTDEYVAARILALYTHPDNWLMAYHIVDCLNYLVEKYEKQEAICSQSEM